MLKGNLFSQCRRNDAITKLLIIRIRVSAELIKPLQLGDQLIMSCIAVGVELEPAAAVEELLPFPGQLQIVVLHFDNFTDGRAFGQARLLRDRYVYRADIRASLYQTLRIQSVSVGR